MTRQNQAFPKASHILRRTLFAPPRSLALRYVGLPAVVLVTLLAATRFGVGWGAAVLLLFFAARFVVLMLQSRGPGSPTSRAAEE